jgi:hypothetical protein
MQTKFKIVETEDYILAVSDEDIKEDDLALISSYVGIVVVGDIDNMPYSKPHRYWQGLTCDTCFDVEEISKFQKIIAYQPKGNTVQLNLPLLPEVVVESEVEKLAEKYADFSNDYIPMSFGGKFNETSKRDFIAGYKAATKTYSEEDLRKAINMARGIKEGKETFTAEDISGSTEVCTYGWKFEFDEDEIIQSLKQPKWFVAEMTVVSDEIDHIYSGNIRYGLKTITINNKTYLVGTYLN